MNNKYYYYKRFRQIPAKIINKQYDRNRWILRILDKNLKDPAECGVNYFYFLIAKCIEIGEEAISQVLLTGVPLYDFIQEHEKRKKQRAKMSAISKV